MTTRTATVPSTPSGAQCTPPIKPGQIPVTSRGPDMSTCHRSSGRSWASPSRLRRNRTSRGRRTWTRPALTSRCRGCLHPSQYSPEVRARVDAQNAAIADAEAAITTSLDAHFTAWDREAEP